MVLAVTAGIGFLHGTGGGHFNTTLAEHEVVVVVVGNLVPRVL